MNQKTARKYQLICNIASNNKAFESLVELVVIDFTTAFEMWEFALSSGADAEFVALGLDLFLKTSELKTKQLFAESLPLQKLVYNSPAVMNQNVITFLVNYIIANKLEVADECLQKMRTNPSIDFNEALRMIVDFTFVASCDKNQTKVPVLNKKQKTLLVSYIEKIKGPNKALLLQRMKEI